MAHGNAWTRLTLAAALVSACLVTPRDYPVGDLNNSGGTAAMDAGATGAGATSSSGAPSSGGMNGSGGSSGTGTGAASGSTFAGTGGNAGGATGENGGDTSGGTGTSGGSSGGDSSGVGGAPSLEGFSLQYQVEQAGTTSEFIGALLRIAYDGDASLPLSELRVRYYFTSDDLFPSAQVNWSLFGPVSGGQDSVTMDADVIFLPSPVSGADAYVELLFQTFADIAPGYEITCSWKASVQGSGTLDQSNDYSFDAGKTALAEWDKVVVMFGENVVWGAPP